jgi:hypothetical protein
MFAHGGPNLHMLPYNILLYNLRHHIKDMVQWQLVSHKRHGTMVRGACKGLYIFKWVKVPRYIYDEPYI